MGEKSEAIRARGETARSLQRERFEGTRLTYNADMTPIEIREFCHIDSATQSPLQAAVKQLSFSARSFHHILKLTRTIADLDGAETIKANHLADS